jgi:hypothetical protein
VISFPWVYWCKHPTLVQIEWNWRWFSHQISLISKSLPYMIGTRLMCSLNPPQLQLAHIAYSARH